VEERGWEYRRRRPEETVLYEAVRENLATLLARRTARVEPVSGPLRPLCTIPLNRVLIPLQSSFLSYLAPYGALSKSGRATDMSGRAADTPSQGPFI
jgi:hypothetical protein